MRTGDNNKDPIGWFGTFLDIDDRKKIEEINKADQAKSRFLASMSHGKRPQKSERDKMVAYVLYRNANPTFWCDRYGLAASHYSFD